MKHIPKCKLSIIGSNNGLLPERRQAIIWTNAKILLIGPSGTNFSEILIRIHTFSFKKMHLKMLSIWSQPQCVNYRNTQGFPLSFLFENHINFPYTSQPRISDYEPELMNRPLCCHQDTHEINTHNRILLIDKKHHRLNTTGIPNTYQGDYVIIMIN